MFLFKKKRVADKTKEDRELISENSKSIDSLLVLASGNENLSEELKVLQEKLKYLIPSSDSKILEYDKTIKNKIGDLRIVLVKADGEDSPKIARIVTDLNLAVADRNSKF